MNTSCWSNVTSPRHFIMGKNSYFSICFQITSRGKIRALLQKNFLRMWRNVGVMLFIFALPVMQVILFCLAIGRDPNGLKLAVANMEMNGTVSQKLQDIFHRSPSMIFFLLSTRNASLNLDVILADSLVDIWATWIKVFYANIIVIRSRPLRPSKAVKHGVPFILLKISQTLWLLEWL